MKTQLQNLFIVLLFAGAIGSLQAQTIRIANNNPGAPGGTNVYTGNDAIQNAINASSSGDIIHVIPSSIDYNNFTINRGVSIYGIGTNPDKEGNKSSKVDIVYSTSGNWVLSGMRINDYLRLAYAGSTSHNNILIENCYIGNYIDHYYNSTYLGNLTIRNNVIDGITTGSHSIEFIHNLTSNISITNNIICVKDQPDWAGINVNGGAVITNNLFLSTGAGLAFADVDGSVIKNNIFLGCSPRGVSGVTLSNNTYSNNLTYQCATASFPIDINGNVGDTTLIDIDPQFVDPNVIPRTNWSFSF